MHERIETTVTKAKAVRPKVEQVITLAKRDTLHARRQAAAYLFEPKAVKKLFDTIGPRFADRQGGYTRIMRLGPRSGDGAETAILELLGAQLEKKAETKRQRRESRMNEQAGEVPESADEQPDLAESAAENSEESESKEKP